MPPGPSPEFVKQVARSRPVQVSLAVGLINAVAAVGIRIWSGAWTAIRDPSILWMLAGGVILGATIAYLYLRMRLTAPAAVALLFLIVGGLVTRYLYMTAGEDALNYAFTPMTIYTTFWPIVFALVVIVGAIEWAIRNRTRVRHPTPT